LTSESNALVTTGVVLLAVGAVVARQLAASRSIRARTRNRCLLATYGFSTALGIAGLSLALFTGDSLRGITYVMVGAIFALAGWRVEAAAPSRDSA
jgi:hypothetical protein